MDGQDAPIAKGYFACFTDNADPMQLCIDTSAYTLRGVVTHFLIPAQLPSIPFPICLVRSMGILQEAMSVYSSYATLCFTRATVPFDLTVFQFTGKPTDSARALRLRPRTGFASETGR